MYRVEIRRASDSRLHIRYPTHQSHHHISDGPITIKTFGNKTTADLSSHFVEVELPHSHPKLEIFDVHENLICAWEPSTHSRHDSADGKFDHNLLWSP